MVNLFPFFFFFFKAKDGIRDVLVTGVQTCALPISCREEKRRRFSSRQDIVADRQFQIGRASCRGRGEISVGAGSFKKKKKKKLYISNSYDNRTAPYCYSLARLT